MALPVCASRYKYTVGLREATTVYLHSTIRSIQCMYYQHYTVNRTALHFIIILSVVYKAWHVRYTHEQWINLVTQYLTL